MISLTVVFVQHREIFVNLRDLYGRQVTLGGDSGDKLRRRLDANAAKVGLCLRVDMLCSIEEGA